jgi:hypothetical protein
MSQDIQQFLPEGYHFRLMPRFNNKPVSSILQEYVNTVRIYLMRTLKATNDYNG